MLGPAISLHMSTLVAVGALEIDLGQDRRTNDGGWQVTSILS